MPYHLETLPRMHYSTTGRSRNVLCTMINYICVGLLLLVSRLTQTCTYLSTVWFNSQWASYTYQFCIHHIVVWCQWVESMHSCSVPAGHRAPRTQAAEWTTRTHAALVEHCLGTSSATHNNVFDNNWQWHCVSNNVSSLFINSTDNLQSF